MVILATTEITMDFDDVGDVVSEAIQEALREKGITVNAMKISIASAKHSLPYTSIRDFCLKIEGDFEP
jgi:hypothetical protein